MQFTSNTDKVESAAKRWILVIGLGLIIVACGILLYKLLSKPVGSGSAANAGACVASGGSFNPEHNECTGINKAKCALIKGKYIQCGSPCRHSPKAEFCPQVCAEYCQF